MDKPALNRTEPEAHEIAQRVSRGESKQSEVWSYRDRGNRRRYGVVDSQHMAHELPVDARLEWHYRDGIPQDMSARSAEPQHTIENGSLA